MMMLVTSIYTIVDGYFVSNYAGSTEFAAMNIIWPAIALVMAIGLMMGTGGSALVSKAIGEGDRDRANTLFTMIVAVTAIIGIISTLLLILLMKPLALALGSDAEMLPHAMTYGRIVTIGLVGSIFQSTFQSFYMTAEKPQLGTIMSVVSGLANIGLDALFVVCLGMGLPGAAIATALSMAIGGIFPLWYFASSHNDSDLKFVRISSIDWKAIASTCTNGTSEYVGNVAMNVVSIGYNIQLMKYIGQAGVSAYGILMYAGFILAAFFIGYNICSSQVIAYNFGAGNRKELRSILRNSIIIISIFGILLTSVIMVCAPAIARIFVGYDSELCEITVHAMRIYMLSFLLAGFNMFCSAWFTALSNGLISAIASFARTIVFEMGCVFALPAIIGIDGIWASVDVAEVLAFILTVSLIFGFRKRYL